MGKFVIKGFLYLLIGVIITLHGLSDQVQGNIMVAVGKLTFGFYFLGLSAIQLIKINRLDD